MCYVKDIFLQYSHLILFWVNFCPPLLLFFFSKQKTKHTVVSIHILHSDKTIETSLDSILIYIYKDCLHIRSHFTGHRKNTPFKNWHIHRKSSIFWPYFFDNLEINCHLLWSSFSPIPVFYTGRALNKKRVKEKYLSLSPPYKRCIFKMSRTDIK